MDKIEQDLGIEVTKEEYFVTFRQTISVADADSVKMTNILAYLQAKMAGGRVTGHIRHNLSQGGTTNIVTEEIARVPAERAKVVDGLFIQSSPKTSLTR